MGFSETASQDFEPCSFQETINKFDTQKTMSTHLAANCILLTQKNDKHNKNLTLTFGGLNG